LADVVEEAVHRDDPVALLFDADRQAVTRAGRAGDRPQIALDVAATIKLGDARQAGVDVGQVPTEVPQLRRPAFDRRAGEPRAELLQVGDHRRA
jgi:hypothetical protein